MTGGQRGLISLGIALMLTSCADKEQVIEIESILEQVDKGEEDILWMVEPPAVAMQRQICALELGPGSPGRDGPRQSFGPGRVSTRLGPGVEVYHPARLTGICHPGSKGKVLLKGALLPSEPWSTDERFE